ALSNGPARNGYVIRFLPLALLNIRPRCELPKPKVLSLARQSLTLSLSHSGPSSSYHPSAIDGTFQKNFLPARLRKSLEENFLGKDELVSRSSWRHRAGDERISLQKAVLLR